LLFTLSLYHNTIGNTLFVFSAYPIVAALLAHFILKEKITKRLGTALVLLFCVLFLLFDPNHLATYLLGNVYALLACISFAIYIICSRILTKRGNAPETVTLWSVGLAAATSGTIAVGFEPFAFSLQPLAIFYLLLFGLLNAAAFNLVNKGFATVNAGVGTMILLLEPILGSFAGLLIFHEIPTITFVLGAIIMITAMYVATFKLD
jgi:drug/metabolite transporter (DMT)-like permease